MEVLNVLNDFYGKAGVQPLQWWLEVPRNLPVNVRRRTIKGSFWADLGIVGGDGRDVELTIHAVTGLPCCSE